MEVSGEPHVFTALPLATTEYKDGYEPHSHSGCYRGKKDFCPNQDLNPWIVQLIALSLI